MDIRINSTLLNNLFESPKPIAQKETTFKALYSRMFPCPKVFRDFLSTSDMSEKIEQAKYIIQRLCFESNYPPPYALIINLEEFENADINKTGNQYYVPQDHFCHLVYLYLLGIYLYFYVPIINKDLTTEFLTNRAESRYDLAMNAAKDFISFWKYFCLYHDLSYPIEQVRGIEEMRIRELDKRIKKSTNNDEIKELQKQKEEVNTRWKNHASIYLEYFDNLHALIRRELFIEAGTKLLVVWQLIKDPANKMTISQVIDRTRNISESWTENKIPANGTNQVPTAREITSQQIKDIYGEFKIIEKLHNYEHMKMLSGFVEDKTYISVLIDSDTELPVAFKITEPTGITYLFPNTTRTKNTRDLAQQYLDSEEPLVDSHYYIRYYLDLDNIKADDLMLIRTLDETFSDDDYTKIIRTITENITKQPETDVRFGTIATSADLSSYIFHLYRAFSSLVNSIYDLKKEADIYQVVSSRKTNRYKEKMKAFLDDHFYELFEEAVSDKIAKRYMEMANDAKNELKEDIIPSKINKFVNGMIDAVFENDKIDEYKEDIKKEFTKKITDALKNEMESTGLLIDFILSCNNSLFEGLQSNDEIAWKTKNILFKGQNKKETFINALNELLKDDPDYINIGEDLKKRIKQTKKAKKEPPELDQFITKYETDYSTCDHGLFSSLIFLICSRYYQDLTRQLFSFGSMNTGNGDPKENSIRAVMSTLCWNVEKSKHVNKLESNYTQIINRVFKGIFYHNIYPDVIENIKLPTWKYDFSEEPSNYFGMLVDMLQIWNRPKYYRRDYLDWWPLFSSDFYNISVKNNTIILEIKNYDSQFSEIEKKFIRDTEKYLNCFSAFVKIGRIEL